MPRLESRQAGFTLLEALAALVVTAAVVAVVLPFATRLAARWWAGEMTVEDADAWLQTVTRMSDDLAQAVPFGLGNGDAKPAAAFRADLESVRFVRPSLGRDGGTRRLEVVTYTIRATSAGRALIRDSRAFDPLRFDDATSPGASVRLLDGPFRLRLVAIARDGSRRRTWSGADGMPSAVELSAVAEAGRPVPIAPIRMPLVAREPALSAKPAGADF